MELKQKILNQFEKYPYLKVLLFFDEKKELEEEIEQLRLSDIRIVKFGDDPFSLKIKLREEWASEKVFLYFTFATPSKQDEYKKFPLMDVLVANKELKLGDVNEFMEQYQLPTAKQSLVTRYMQELKFYQIQAVLKPILNAHSFIEEALQRGLVSAFLKFNEPQTWDTLLTKLFVLTKPINNIELKRVDKKLRETKLESVVIRRLSDLLDDEFSHLSLDSLAHLLSKIKYNAIISNLPLAKHDPYGSLRIRHNVSLIKFGIFFEQARTHPKLGPEFIETLLLHGQHIKEETIHEFYGPDAEYAWMPDNLKWLILTEHMKDIYDNPVKALSGLEKMSLRYEENKEIGDLLNICLYSANCFKLINSIRTYRLNTPEEYVAKYNEEYYKIDTSYRKAINKLGTIDHTEIPAFVPYDKLRAILNKHYDEWLEKLNREWLSCLHTKQFDYSKLSMPKQYDFYVNEVAPFSEQKCVVIISDALRYEVAVELLHEMHNDSKSEAAIRYMMASIPSKTSVGMSNLLPGKDRLFNDDKITIDGLSATSRDSILKSTNANALAVSYSAIEQNTLEKNRELFKAPIVYIYHDVIDATGDKQSSQRRTFNVIGDAINEIKRLIKKIHSSYNVSRIIITSDHGFIYNDQTISDVDKEDSPCEGALIDHKRFSLYAKPINPKLGYCFPLKATTRFEDERWIVIPASTNRYKRQGVAHQFAHGGASLQEVIVPVIESARRREDITRKVTVKLLTTEPKIVSNVLKVEILQENNVNRYEKARTVKLGIYRSYDLVSTLHEVSLDSASEMASERLYVCTLRLTKPDLEKSALTLKVFDVDDDLNTLIEKPVKNSTLIQTDF